MRHRTVVTSELAAMLKSSAAKLREQHSYLGELDSVGGDGDHGVTILKVSSVMDAALESSGGKSARQILEDIGWGLLNLDGGAAGPLLGSMFLGMASAADQLETGGSAGLDGASLAKVVEAGVTAMCEQTKAKPGDKTMLDALVPAAAAVSKAAPEMPLGDCLRESAVAARRGAEATSTMRARFGRAQHLGDRTLGHLDPGAMSIALIFEGFYEGFRRVEGK
jgi:dihydroxyacetone kinase-like protein